MGSDNELIRLEQYIERLLGGYSELKQVKRRVEGELAELQAENRRMRQELEVLAAERGVMRDRVNGLIGQIEQWESESGAEAGEQVIDSASAEVETDYEAAAEEPPVDEKRKGERGVKAQKNLFSG